MTIQYLFIATFNYKGYIAVKVTHLQIRYPSVIEHSYRKWPCLVSFPSKHGEFSVRYLNVETGGCPWSTWHDDMSLLRNWLGYDDP